MIEVRNLNKSFEAQKALNDLSLRVNTGSIYGLVGTNGSGKTTLLKHITGQELAGVVVVNGVFMVDEIAYVADGHLNG